MEEQGQLSINQGNLLKQTSGLIPQPCSAQMMVPQAWFSHSENAAVENTVKCLQPNVKI